MHIFAVNGTAMSRLSNGDEDSDEDVSAQECKNNCATVKGLRFYWDLIWSLSRIYTSVGYINILHNDNKNK